MLKEFLDEPTGQDEEPATEPPVNAIDVEGAAERPTAR